MNWFFLSLLAILFWSGSDFFSKLGSPARDKNSHLKMTAVVGITMGIHAVYMMTAGGVTVTLRDIIVYLPASLCYILSMAVGYAGLRYIELSVSSPVCNTSGAVAAILCAVFLGQSMGSMQLIGVAAVTAGVVALEAVDIKLDGRFAKKDNYVNSLKAILYPLIYCAVDGLGTFADAWLLGTYIEEDPANVAYELTFLLTAVISLIYLIGVKKDRFWENPLPEIRRLELPKVLAAIVETAGQYFYIFALSANAILSAPLISAYCVVSMIWSRIFLKEKLSKGKYIAIAITVIGIIILGASDA